MKEFLKTNWFAGIVTAVGFPLAAFFFISLASLEKQVAVNTQRIGIIELQIASDHIAQRTFQDNVIDRLARIETQLQNLQRKP